MRARPPVTEPMLAAAALAVAFAVPVTLVLWLAVRLVGARSSSDTEQDTPQERDAT
jgi:hypothetical protein